MASTREPASSFLNASYDPSNITSLAPRPVMVLKGKAEGMEQIKSLHPRVC